MSNEAKPAPSKLGWMVRLELTLFAAMIIVVVVGGILIWRYRASRDEPITIDVFPGATLVLEEVVREGFDHFQYVVADDVAVVETFYDEQPGMACERQYAPATDEAAEMSANAHMYTRCRVDHSGWGMSQSATVMIQPVLNASGTATGDILIDVQRQWGG